MPSLEQLKKQARKINGQIGVIEDAARAKENRKLLGKCFRYQNNYSCPEKPSDYWWLFAKVIAVSDNGYITLFEFQTDQFGETTIRPKNKYRTHMHYYEEISSEQFSRAWNDLKNRLNRISA